MGASREFIISLIYVTCLFWSKAGMSISIACLFLLGLWYKKKDLVYYVKQFFNNYAYAGPSVVFFVILLSGINSHDTREWLNLVRLMLPFLLLPVAFYLLPRPSRKEHKNIHLFLGFVCIVNLIPLLWNFSQNFTLFVDELGRGKSIPTPIDHIHFSIILAYSCLSLVALLADKKVKKSKIEKYYICISIFILFTSLHILSVRTGLAIVYSGLGFISFWLSYSRNKRVYLIIGIFTILFFPVLTYYTIPTINSKINYMVYDLNQYRRGFGNNYSDSERLMSYKIAIDLAKEKPIFGQGIGDIKSLMVDYHQQYYGEKEKYILPHNQYLFILAGTGLLGAILYFIGLLSPIIYSKPKFYLWLIYLVILLSFLVENTAHRAVSIAFFLLFIYWNLGRDTKK